MPSYPPSTGTGQTVLGAVLLGLSAACAVIVLMAVTGLLEGRFGGLPFFQQFLDFVSRNDSLTLTVQGEIHRVKIPQSVFFISAVSLFLFALSIAAKLLRALIAAGVHLIQGRQKQYGELTAQKAGSRNEVRINQGARDVSARSHC